MHNIFHKKGVLMSHNRIHGSNNDVMAESLLYGVHNSVMKRFVDNYMPKCYHNHIYVHFLCINFYI